MTLRWIPLALVAALALTASCDGDAKPAAQAPAPTSAAPSPTPPASPTRSGADKIDQIKRGVLVNDDVTTYSGGAPATESRTETLFGPCSPPVIALTGVQFTWGQVWKDKDRFYFVTSVVQGAATGDPQAVVAEIRTTLPGLCVNYSAAGRIVDFKKELTVPALAGVAAQYGWCLRYQFDDGDKAKFNTLCGVIMVRKVADLTLVANVRVSAFDPGDAEKAVLDLAPKAAARLMAA
ncbi:hypothetical protein AB0M43_25290 [Longispora sp. NPDC051575]|uniref:hypothetical protein n=1 Tax=Longispora sp. NPDC051575 TaxID=3154943 RepID=UPI003449C197